MALVDYFLKIDGIAGESFDDKHKGEIEVESFSWGVTQTATLSGGGAGAGKAVFQDLHFTKMLDKASPVLMLKCATGEHIKSAVLTARSAAIEGQPQEFLKLTFSDVLVSSYQDGGSGDARTLPIDAVALHYATVQNAATQPARVEVPALVAGGITFVRGSKDQWRFTEGAGEFMTVGITEDGAVDRAFAEYDVHDALSLLTAPFGDTKLTLEVTARDASTGLPTGKRQHKPFTMSAYLYQPADGRLSPEDFTREGEHVATIHMDGLDESAVVMADLGRRLRRSGDGTFGIRIEVTGMDDWESPVAIRGGAEPHLGLAAQVTARLTLTTGG